MIGRCILVKWLLIIHKEKKKTEPEKDIHAFNIVYHYDVYMYDDLVPFAMTKMWCMGGARNRAADPVSRARMGSR